MYPIIFIFFALILIYFATRNIFSVTFLTGVGLIQSFIGCWFIVGNISSRLSIYFSLSIFLLALGIILANKIKKFSPLFELRKIRKRKINFFLKSNIPFFFALSILLILNIFLIFILFFRSGIPFFAESSEEAKVEIGLVRENLLMIRALRIFLPFLILVLFLYMLKTKKLLIKLGFLFFLILIGIIHLFYGYKGYFLAFVVTPLLMLYSFEKKIKLKNIILLVLLVLFFLFPILSKALNTSDPITLFKYVFIRSTIGQAEGMDLIVNHLIPKEGLFYGTTFKMDIESFLYKIGIIKNEVLNFNAFLVKYKTGSNPQGRIQMSSTLFGDFYANFGLFIALFGTFLFGFFLQILYIKSVRSSKDILFLPTYIFFQSIFSGAIVNGHFLLTLIDIGICTLFIVFLLIFFYIIFSLPIGKIIFTRIKS